MIKQEGLKGPFRSPEEKVKCHTGAIYRGPFMFYTKHQGSGRFLQKDF